MRPDSFSFTLLLGCCAGLPALSIDLSAPTLTLLPEVLSTNQAVAGLSLSLFMVGFAFGQFVGGRQSDRVGRRPVLLISLAVYTLSGLCCSLATTGPMLAVARLVQGFGAGACAVQASAMVQDWFEGETARQKQSYVAVVLTTMPMLAPALGSIIVLHFGWRSVHVVLAAAGLCLAAVISLLVPESRREGAIRPRGLGLNDALVMMRGAVFRRIALVNALSYGAIFAYIAGAPVVVMRSLGQPPVVFAALFAGTALALSAGAMTNARLGRRGVSSDRLVWPGLLVQSAAAAVLVLAGPKLPQGAFVAIPALLVASFARGLLSPNLVHLAVSRHRERAGLASAVVGVTQLLVGAVASALVASLLTPFGYYGLAIPMLLFAGAATTVWRAMDGFVRSQELLEPGQDWATRREVR